MSTLLVYTHLDNPTAYPPLGIVHLGTEIESVGGEVWLHDMSWDQDLGPIRRRVNELKPDTVGLSTLSINYETSKRVGELSHSAGARRIVMGGAHACTGPTDWPYENHPGPYFFDRNLIPNRSLLPTFRKNLRTNPGFPYLMPWTYVIASRGCPFDCSFCQPVLRKLWGRRTVHRTVESVISEIEGLVSDYGIKSFTFMDDTMISNRDWLEDLCLNLARLNIPWTAQTNVRTVTRGCLKQMKEAGCYFIGMGVESGSERVNREVYNKPQTRKEIRKAFDWCRELSIMTEATLIIGAPDETEAEMNETAELMKEVNPDVVDLHILTPTPGSHIFNELRRSGVSNSYGEGDYDRYTVGAVVTDVETGRIRKAYWRIIKSWLHGKNIWSPKQYWWRWLWSIRRGGPSATIEGGVRFLIYHSYFWHRTLKEMVWWWRRR